MQTNEFTPERWRSRCAQRLGSSGLRAVTGRVLLAVGALVTLGPAVRAVSPSPAGTDLPGTVTFTEHVAPIVFQSCSSCHRPGAGTPFSLLSYQDVKKRAQLIDTVTESGYMPPWPPAAGWGHFQDERRLSETQVALIHKWVEGGMVEGPREKLPPLPRFAEGGWTLGKPDLVVTLPEAFDVPADGPDIYRMFVLPLNLTDDQWVTAVEIQPSARSVVHHALYFLDNTGAARRLDAESPGPGFSRMGFPRTGTLGGWAVGATPRHLPMGLAYPLKKGSDLVVQVHFHPSGKAEREKTTLGLYFAKERPKKQLLGMQTPLAFGIGTELRTIGIKPGEKDFTIRGEWEVPFDIDVVVVGGHAHYLCKTMKAVAELPNGEEVKLFAIDDWDFNWQGRYNYASPVRLPKGAVIRTTLIYDNSEENPRNPSHPPVHVRWGEGSTDEMGSIGLAFVAVNEGDIAAYRGPTPFAGGDQVGRFGNGAVRGALLRGVLTGEGAAGRGAGANLTPERLRAQLEARDADKNGKLEGDEIPERLRPFVDRIDTNGDGALDRAELRRVFRAMMQRSGGGGSADSGDDAKPSVDTEDEAKSAGTSDEARSSAEPAPKPEPSTSSSTSVAAPAPKPTAAMFDIDGRARDPLHPAPGVKAQVLLFVTHDCPVANHYAAEIERLAHDYAGKPVTFLLVHADPETTPELARAHAKEYQLSVPILIDREHVLVKAAGAKVTPEAAVVASDGQIVYSGRIDDRFTKLGRQRPEPTQHELRVALDAVLAGQAVTVTRADAVGCPIADLRQP